MNSVLNRSGKRKITVAAIIALLAIISYTTTHAFPAISPGFIDTVAGSATAGFGGDGGPATSAFLKYPYGTAVDAAGNIIIADNANHRVRRVDAVTGFITTVAGNGGCCFDADGVVATSTKVGYPNSVALDMSGNIFIATGSRIRKVDAVTGIITTVAGGGFLSGTTADGGLATDAELPHPEAVAVDSAGNIFIADDDEQLVRRVDVSTGIITTVAGNGAYGFSGDGGLATNASFRYPSMVAIDAAGNIFITDQANHAIRRVDVNTGIIDTVAGTGGSNGFGGDGGPAVNALLRYPSGIALDADGNLFIADVDNHRVRKVDAGTGDINSIAGTGINGFSGDGGPAINATFSYPIGVALDASGNLFLADTNNSSIRRVFLGLPDSEGPVTSDVLVTPNPVAIDLPGLILSANIDDGDAGGSNIASADYSLDGGATWVNDSMNPDIAPFDLVTEMVSSTIGTFSEAEVIEVCVRGRDEAGNVGDQECVFLAVYDPDGGFVTGGGWIYSAPGAYVDDPLLEGKANFGFVSKYKKGASIPTGNTEFNFKAGDLNFHSEAYEWLVVNQNGVNAQYKGTGTINGDLAPNDEAYKFMIWAKDLDPGSDDTFRIKIWYEHNGNEMIVYDNGFDQEIGGGNIKIHDGK